MRPLHGQSETLLGSRQFRRLLLWSACAHVAIFALTNLRILSRTTAVIPPSPVMVELVAPPSAGGASKGAAAAPAPARPKPERVVNLPKPKPEPPKPKTAPAPKPKPVAKPVPAPAPPKPAAPEAPTRSAAEVLAALRERVAAKPGAETDAAAIASSTGSGAPSGGRFDPVMAAYHDRIKALLRSNWANAAFANDPSLRAHYLVRVDNAGGILSVDLVQSSGNPYFDESAERAIKKSAPWPAPPRGAFELDLVFNPGGVA